MDWDEEMDEETGLCPKCGKNGGELEYLSFSTMPIRCSRCPPIKRTTKQFKAKLAKEVTEDFEEWKRVQESGKKTS